MIIVIIPLHFNGVKDKVQEIVGYEFYAKINILKTGKFYSIFGY